MTIAIDARIIFTSTGRYVYRLIEYLQQVDTKNQYIILLQKKDFANWDPTAPNVRKVLADFPPNSFAEQLAMTRLLNSLKPDLVHYTMPNHPIAYRGPFVMTVHDLTLVNYINRRKEGTLKDFYTQEVKPRVFKHVLSLGFRRARHIITPTQFVRHQLIDQFNIPAGRVSHTYEAGDKLGEAAKEYVPLRNKRFIVYVGNAFPYKNLRCLVDAFAQVQNSQPNLHLILAGKKEFFYEELERYVASQNIKNIHIPGFISDAELAWLYQHAELYVFPSLSEGFGLPGLEAMTYGTPVASSNATCLPEVYGDAAVYFDPNDTDDIARVISETLSNKSKLAELQKAGPKQAAKYSWRRMAEQTLEIYKNALK